MFYSISEPEEAIMGIRVLYLVILCYFSLSSFVSFFLADKVRAQMLLDRVPEHIVNVITPVAVVIYFVFAVVIGAVLWTLGHWICNFSARLFKSSA